MPRVHAYKNLTTGTYSLREGGKVVAHPTHVLLRDVEFRVANSERQRAIRTGQRNVHAYIVGELERAASRPRGSWLGFRYNPFLFKTFVLRDNLAPVHRAARVWMDADGAWLELEPEDRGLIQIPRINPTVGEPRRPWLERYLWNG